MKVIYNKKENKYGLANDIKIIIEPCFESISKVDFGYACVKKNTWYRYTTGNNEYYYESNLNNLNNKSSIIFFEQTYIDEWVFLDIEGNQRESKRLAVIEPFNFGVAISAIINYDYEKKIEKGVKTIINEEGRIVFGLDEIRSILPSNISYIDYYLTRIDYKRFAMNGEFYRPGKAFDSKEGTYIFEYDINGAVKIVKYV